MSAPAEQSMIESCAASLARAEAERRPIPPLTDTHTDLSVANAYRIQQLNIDRRIAAGERLVGHKIGLTSKAMQDQFGVNEPDFGHLLDTMVVANGAPLDLDQLIDPRIEIEPAFVLGKPLRGPGVSPADVIAATDYVSVCFEIIDSRIIDWRIKLQDTVADNGSSARLVLGTQRVRPTAVKLADLATTLALDGTVVERGNTSAILGDPANSVAWFANRIAEYGLGLDAGHIVLPGTCTRSWRIHGRRQLGGRIDGLGELLVAVRGTPIVTDKV